MSNISDLLRAVGRVVAVGERITELSDRLQRLEQEHQKTRERLVRVEAFISVVQPAVERRITDSKEE